MNAVHMIHTNFNTTPKRGKKKHPEDLKQKSKPKIKRCKRKKRHEQQGHDHSSSEGNR